jgi:hypothetical protein
VSALPTWKIGTSGLASVATEAVAATSASALGDMPLSLLAHPGKTNRLRAAKGPRIKDFRIVTSSVVSLTQT